MKMLDRFISWFYTRRIYGIRCSTYSVGCACCGAWKFHDELFG